MIIMIMVIERAATIKITIIVSISQYYITICYYDILSKYNAIL